MYFNKIKLSRSSGFTLVELVVTVVVIGVLAALSIAQFSTYQQKAYDSTAQSQVISAATSIEAYKASNITYPLSTLQYQTNGSYTGNPLILPGFVYKPGVFLSVSLYGNPSTIPGQPPGIYNITACHKKGTPDPYYPTNAVAFSLHNGGLSYGSGAGKIVEVYYMTECS